MSDQFCFMVRNDGPVPSQMKIINEIERHRTFLIHLCLGGCLHFVNNNNNNNNIIIIIIISITTIIIIIIITIAIIITTIKIMHFCGGSCPNNSLVIE